MTLNSFFTSNLCFYIFSGIIVLYFLISLFRFSKGRMSSFQKKIQVIILVLYILVSISFITSSILEKNLENTKNKNSSTQIEIEMNNNLKDKGELK